VYEEGNPISSTDAASPTTDFYTNRVDRYTQEHREISRRWSTIANLRLAVFAIIALTAWWAWDQVAAWLLVVIVLEVALVLWLIARHTRLRHQRDLAKRMIDVNTRALARYRMEWSDLPDLPEHRITREHPYAWDLNVVGEASLLRRIGSPVTRGAWDLLIARLTATNPVTDVASRQQAIAELAGEIDLRQEVEAAGMRDEGPLRSPHALLEWAESPRSLDSTPWLRWFARISPLLTIGLMLAQVFGATAWPLWLVPIVIQLIVSQLFAADASAQVAQVAPLHREIAGYVDIFRAIESSNPRAADLIRLRDDVIGDHASVSVGRLSRVCSLAIPVGTLLYLPFQMFLLWDVNVLSVMERWRSQHGHRIRHWLDVVAEWESLAALSILAHDHYDWTFPDLDPAHQTFRASDLRHPLIESGVAVGNDVEVGPRGTVLFVTGSNMSGKSTLLRAIGLNTVLARAGAPVAASSCSLPSLDIRCCMRVEDSVDRGVSFFMAELLRLKSVVDAAHAVCDQPVLYLLDEILQGTNTAERQIASRRVMRSLAATNAIGAVSSHDLELFDAEDIAGLAHYVHFAEQFDRSVMPPLMHFDYRLRPGIATSTNALALMEMLGFDREV
jgi:ABC-type multidrug transport system fused ATPase/permease subunit